ncbi:MAG: hypothetical protein RR951_01910 [Ruthenibacterium sp.]
MLKKTGSIALTTAAFPAGIAFCTVPRIVPRHGVRGDLHAPSLHNAVGKRMKPCRHA